MLKKLRVDFDANTTGFDKGLKHVKSGISGVSSGLKSMAKSGLAIAGITVGIAGLATGLKKAHAEFLTLESSAMRVQDIFRDSSKYIDGFAQNTARQFGMAESTAYSYAATYGNLFKGITRDTQENAKVTTAMLKASAVIASKTGRTMEDTNSRIRSGILGSNEAIEDLGINVLVSSLKMTDAFKQIADGRSWEKLTFAEQQQIRVLGILEQAQKSYGDTVASNGAFAMASFTESLKDLKAYAGMFVDAGLRPIIKGLTEIVRGATEGIKALSALFGIELKAPKQDADGTDAQVAAQDKLTDAVKDTAKERQRLAGFDEITTLSDDGKAVSSAAPAAGLGASVFDGIAMPDSFEIKEPKVGWIPNLKAKFQGLGDWFTTTFAPSISSWGSAFSKIPQPAQDAFVSVSGSAKNLWSGTLVPFGSYLANEWVPGIANSFSTTFAPIFADVMPVAFSEFARNFDFAARNIGSIVQDIIQPTFVRMQTVITDVFSGIKSAWDRYGGSLLRGFQEATAGIRRIWDSFYGKVIKPISDRIGAAFDKLWKNHLKPLWDSVTNFVASITNMALAIWNKVLAPLVEFLVNKFGPPLAKLVGWLVDVFGDVFGFIADVLRGFLNFLSGIADKISSFLGVDVNFPSPDSVPKANPPNIPALDTGGIVYNRSVVEVAEYAGARSNPEVIAPLDKLAALLGGAGDGDTVLTANIVLEDGTLVGRTTQRIRRRNQVVGAEGV